MTDLIWSPERQAWLIVIPGVHVSACNAHCDHGSHWLAANTPVSGQGERDVTRWGELIPHDHDDPECQCDDCCEDRDREDTPVGGREDAKESHPPR